MPGVLRIVRGYLLTEAMDVVILVRNKGLSQPDNHNMWQSWYEITKKRSGRQQRGVNRACSCAAPRSKASWPGGRTPPSLIMPLDGPKPQLRRLADAKFGRRGLCPLSLWGLTLCLTAEGGRGAHHTHTTL